MKAEFCRVCDYSTPTPATCIEPSKVTVACSIAGHNKVINIGSALGHEGINAVPATCTEDGNTETGTCTRTGCGYVGTNTVIPALGHDHSIIAGSGSLVCRRTGCNHQYEIGDTGPGDGIIFYVAPTGFTVQASPDETPLDRAWAEYIAYYLEVARRDEGTFSQWSTQGTIIDNDVTTFTDSEVGVTLIGNGRRDTWFIVNHLDLRTTETGRSAQLCASRTAGAVTDWFLPSLGELNQLFIYRNDVNNAGGSLGTSAIWSSSQNDDFTAWNLNFNTGIPSSPLKSSSVRVRAVRAF
jgi:hypothetical protein